MNVLLVIIMSLLSLCGCGSARHKHPKRPIKSEAKHDNKNKEKVPKAPPKEIPSVSPGFLPLDQEDLEGNPPSDSRWFWQK